ncbi:MAG: DeoR family transcriptional regulator [Candidatus Latescibacteria bacterium]|nr:DeoR family transcriptional regulator [Candidatus Latescibacterota bacterium]
MVKPARDGLTEREGQILNVLWQQGEATVEEVRQRLDTELAPSTLRTLLSIMEDRGYVVARKEGKAKVFCPAVAREAAQASALAMLKERLFGGSTRLLLSRLVEDEEISLEDLDALRQEVKRSKKGGGRR